MSTTHFQAPPQPQQESPGLQLNMNPQPVTDNPEYKASKKLAGKCALISGGDSGIGQAVAIIFAKEGADVGIIYLNEQQDAEQTQQKVEALGQKCLLIPGDLQSSAFSSQAVEKFMGEFGKLDILVNNAATHEKDESLLDISDEQLETTFKTNVFSAFYLTRAALPHLQQGATIINTASVTAYQGSSQLLDYSATKGALVAFTRALSSSLLEKGIRVNGVAPGPIWTPLITSTLPPEEIPEFGKDTPMKRAGQPCEVAPAFVFLACEDSSYISGQFIHPNGGRIVNA